MNRFSQISTSSFKPLDLNEIMMVPLAKQKQEDDAMLALDEFSQLEANSLDADKDYVKGQIDAFQGESDAISTSILEEGVDRFQIQKLQSLRNRKNKELSINGKTGQASAAYNEMLANKQSTERRTDLSAAQKQLGIEKSISDYTGVTEGGQYKNYQGVSKVDIMEKARKITDRMTPTEKAEALGFSLTDDGKYRDGSVIIERLSPKHIEQVAMQALQGDQGVMDYVNEMHGLGIIDDPQAELHNAAVSAGNVAQVYKEKNLRPGARAKPKVDDSMGMVDQGQAWDVMQLEHQGDLFSNAYELIPEDDYEQLFKDGDLSLDAVEAEFAEATQQGVTKKYSMYAPATQNYDVENATRNRKIKEYKRAAGIVNSIRKDNPVLDGVNMKTNKKFTDQEVYDLYNNARKNSLKSFSDVVRPGNQSSSFYKIGESLIGTDARPGMFAQKQMQTADGKSGGIDEIASSYSMDRDELEEDISTSGVVLGFSPGNVDMPGAYVVQYKNRETEQTEIIYMKNEGKAQGNFSDVASMNDAIINNKTFQSSKYTTVSGKPSNKYIATELNPYSGKYEAVTYKTEGDYTKDDLAKMNTGNWRRNPNDPTVQVLYDKENKIIRPIVSKVTYKDEMQRSTDRITKYYDHIANSNQILGKSQKNQ